MAQSPLRVQSTFNSGYGSLNYSVTLNGTAAGNTLILIVSMWEAGGDGAENAIWLSGSGIAGVSFTLASDSGPNDTGGGADFERTRILYCHGIPGGNVTVQVDVNGGTQVALAMQEVSGLASQAPIANGVAIGTTAAAAVEQTASQTTDDQASYVVSALGATSPTSDNYVAGQPPGWWSDISILTAASTHALHVDRRVPPRPERTRINYGNAASDVFWSLATATFKAASGNTTLHLQNTSDVEVGDANLRDLYHAYGFSAVATSTNTTAGGTEIPLNRSDWITPILSDDVTLDGTITFRIYARAFSSNLGTRAKLFVVDADGVSNKTQIGSNADDSTALISTTTLRTLTTTASSVLVAKGRRLKAEYFVIPVGGTMPASTSGHAMNYGGTGASGGYIDLPAAVAFGEYGVASLVAQAPAVAATGEAPASGDAAVTTPGHSVSATGTAGATGAGSVTAQAPSLAATGTAGATGAGAISAAAPSVSGTGSAAASGAGAISTPAPGLAATGAAAATGGAAIAAPAPTVAASGAAPGAETGSAAITVPAPTVQASGIAGAFPDAPLAPTVGAWGAGTVQRIPRDGEGADRLPGPPQRRQAPSIPPGTPLSGGRLGTDAQRMAMLIRLQQQGLMTDAMLAELRALQAVMEAIAQEEDDLAILLLAS